jgi:hypothetical protein
VVSPFVALREQTTILRPAVAELTSGPLGLPHHYPRRDPTVSGCPGRLRQDCGRPAATVPARRQRRVRLRLLVCAGQVSQIDAAGGNRLSGRADTGHGLPDTRSPPAPGMADACDRGKACGHGGSGHAGQPAPDRPPPQLCPTGTGPQCAAPPAPLPDRQIRSRKRWTCLCR